MTLQKILSTLEAMGTAQNRKVYGKHGVSTPLYGVSYANLGKLTKQIGPNHALSQALWETGNHDACILACMVASPKEWDEELCEKWASFLSNYVITDAFSKAVMKTSFAKTMMERWIKRSDQEWICRTGWLLLAGIAMQDSTEHDAFFKPFLQTLQKKIHTQKNRVKDAMNSALIAIGLRSEVLSEEAIRVARLIGKVGVDHGDTSCKTPDAETYIKKARQRKRKFS